MLFYRLFSIFPVLGIALLSGCEDTPLVVDGLKEIQIGTSNSHSVQAYVSKGPVDKAQCNLYTAGNIKVAGPVKSVRGAVDFGTVRGLAQNTPYYVACSGGTYTDESTGISTELTRTLHSGRIIKGAETAFIVTPLTEVAHQKAFDTKSTEKYKLIEDYNRKVGAILGLEANIDPAITMPTDLNTQKGKGDALTEYGLWLAIVSQTQNDGVLGSTLTEVVTNLENCVDIQNEQLDDNCATRMLEATDRLKNNTQAPVNTNLDEASIAAIKENLNQRKSQTQPVRITSVTPSTFLQAGEGPHHLVVEGFGLDAVEQIKLNSIMCRMDAMVINQEGTKLQNIDCSGVMLGNRAIDATLSFITKKKRITILHTVPTNTTPTAHFGPWTQGPSPVILANQTFANTVSIDQPSSCSKGEASIVYSIAPQNAFAAIDASTGAITVDHDFHKTTNYTVTALTPGVLNKCFSNSTKYNLTITNERINKPSQFANPTIEATYGDSILTDYTATCESGDAPTYTASGGGNPVVMVDGTSGAVRLIRSGTAVVTASCFATHRTPGTSNFKNNKLPVCSSQSVTNCYTQTGTSSYKIIVNKASLKLKFSALNRKEAPQQLARELWQADIDGWVGNDKNKKPGLLFYVSSNKEVKVSPTGEILNAWSLAPGTKSRITAKFEDTENKYIPAEASYELTVE